MPNLKDGWFADRAPGGSKVIYTTAGNPATATPVGGIVGIGIDSGVVPILAQFPALPEPGMPLPPPGSNERSSFFAAFKGAAGFDGNTNLTGFPSGFGTGGAWSLSTFINLGVNNVVGFNPDPTITNADPAAPAAPLICAAGYNPGFIDGGLNESFGSALSDLTAFANGFAGRMYEVLSDNQAARIAYAHDTVEATGWAHLMQSVSVSPISSDDAGDPPVRSWGTVIRMMLYINDTAIINSTTIITIGHTGLSVGIVGFDFDHDDPVGPGGLTRQIGASGGFDPSPQPAPLYAGLAELWEAPGHFVDWSIAANRYKFHTSDVGFGLSSPTYAPVDIGPTGARPFGFTPRFYLTGSPSLFVKNRAAGGTLLTVNGHSLVLIDDPPS